ncbi:MAG: CdaR family protein [Prolixibacteraceae bacterium]
MIKQYFNNTKSYLHNFNLRKNNRPFIFSVCFLIASGLWLVNAFGKRYETTVSMPVQYTNLPKNKVLVQAPPSTIEIKMEANGFTLLRHKIKLTINPLNFNIKAFTNNLMSNDNINNYKVASDQFIPQFSRQVSSEIKLIDITPDTLYFQFDQVISEKKAIAYNFELNFENQFFLLDSVRFTPDSVMVRGPKSIVQKMDKVYTKKQKFKNLNTSVKRNVLLEEQDQLQFEPRRVVVNIPVSQYTEYNEKIPITEFNVPDSIKLVTLPGKIDISCLVALTEYKSLSPSSFIIGVDYNDIVENLNALPIKVYGNPGHVKMLKYSPASVKFIIETK